LKGQMDEGERKISLKFKLQLVADVGHAEA
jgi:hypothetical protein